MDADEVTGKLKRNQASVARMSPYEPAGATYEPALPFQNLGPSPVGPVPVDRKRDWKTAISSPSLHSRVTEAQELGEFFHADE